MIHAPMQLEIDGLAVTKDNAYTIENKTRLGLHASKDLQLKHVKTR